MECSTNILVNIDKTKLIKLKIVNDLTGSNI